MPNADRPTTVRLWDLVPEPPDDVLNWSDLQKRIGRRRRRRIGTGVLVATVGIGIVASLPALLSVSNAPARVTPANGAHTGRSPHSRELAALTRRGIYLPTNCYPREYEPNGSVPTRADAVQDACWLMTQMGRGRYHLLLVRRLTAAGASHLLGSLGPRPSARQVWVVVVQGPYRFLSCILANQRSCYQPNAVWGIVLGPGVGSTFSFGTRAQMPGQLRTALNLGPQIR
jgi:hypothetical protein